MDAAEILALLEKPSRERQAFVYQIGDEAAVADIMVALRASIVPHTRSLLCYVLNLWAGAEFLEGRSPEMKLAVPALIESLANSEGDMRGA